MAILMRSASLTNYMDVARAVGLDPYRQLSAAGISRIALLNPDIKIPAVTVGRLLEMSASAASVEDFGLRMAEMRQLSNLGPLAFVVREEPTLRRALEAMAHYLRLQNEALYMRVEETDGLAIIRGDMFAGFPGSVRQITELAMGVLYRLLRMSLDNSWGPRNICFSHSAPASMVTHRRVFGARVEFGQEFDGIVCRAADLDAAMPTYEPGMAHPVRQYLDAMLAQSNAGMADQVRQLVLALLPTGECSVEHVAQHLGVDRSTVRRRLAPGGDSFTSIVDAVRVELVMRYIDSRDRSLSDVATLLGFSSLSAFSRWFGGRFGCSVTDWRREGLAQHGGARVS